MNRRKILAAGARQPLTRARQTLTTRRLSSSQQKQVVQISLLPSPRTLRVLPELFLANSFQHFARLPGLAKNFPLLVARLLQPQQLLFEFPPVTQQVPVAFPIKTQLCSRKSRAQLPVPRLVKFVAMQVQLFDQVAHPRHLLVRRPQLQFLLVLEAVAIMQNRLQRKAEWHGVSPA